MNWSLKAKEKGKLRSDPQHPPHGRVESSLFPHRSQHGECLHVPSRGRGRSGSPPGPSRAHHQPSLLILPACCYPGLPGRWARPLPAPTRPLLSGAGPSSCHTSFLAECGLPGPTEPASHLPASTVQHHGLRGESVGVHGLPALRHAGEGWRWGGSSRLGRPGVLCWEAGEPWAGCLTPLPLQGSP